MSNPKSFSIVSAIVTAIQGIDGTPTYDNTVDSNKQVVAKLVPVHAIKKDLFPFFCVYHAGETRTKEPSHLLNVLDIQIQCFFVNVEQKADGYVEKWLKDIEVALAADVRLGLSYVHDTFVESIVRDTEEIPQVQIFTLNVPVTYSFQFGEP